MGSPLGGNCMLPGFTATEGNECVCIRLSVLFTNLTPILLLLGLALNLPEVKLCKSVLPNNFAYGLGCKRIILRCGGAIAPIFIKGPLKGLIGMQSPLLSALPSSPPKHAFKSVAREPIISGHCTPSFTAIYALNPARPVAKLNTCLFLIAYVQPG